jgi:hypothetical protein
MDKTETFLTLSPADQQLEKITRLLLERRDTCGEWALHTREREDEKEMRRLEKDARCGDLYKQMKKLGAEVEGLRQSGDASGPAPGTMLVCSMHAACSYGGARFGCAHVDGGHSTEPSATYGRNRFFC